MTLQNKFLGKLAGGLSLLLLFSANAQDNLDHFNYQADIILEQSGMFAKVPLNEDVYLQTVSPSLNDLRVFNQKGNLVPFSLVSTEQKARSDKRIQTILYPISETVKTDQEGNHYSVFINGKTIALDVDESKKTPNGRAQQTYLIELPEIAQNANLTQFKLNFNSDVASWKGDASIHKSYDLKSWQYVTTTPIMQLVNDSDHALTLNEIHLPKNREEKSRYWIVTLSANESLPKLTSVDATLSEGSTEEYFGIPMTLVSTDKQNAFYSLKRPIPLKSLEIKLSESGAILPVVVYYKTTKESPHWNRLGTYVLKRGANSDEGTVISLNDLAIAELKLEAVNASIDTPPTIIAKREPMAIIFNSANNAPFTLAWGAKGMANASLSADLLMDGNASIDAIPIAHLGKTSQKTPVPIVEPVKVEPKDLTWLVWVGLLLGIGILLLLATKLLKDIKKEV